MYLPEVPVKFLVLADARWSYGVDAISSEFEVLSSRAVLRTKTLWCSSRSLGLQIVNNAEQAQPVKASVLIEKRRV